MYTYLLLGSPVNVCVCGSSRSRVFACILLCRQFIIFGKIITVLAMEIYY